MIKYLNGHLSQGFTSLFIGRMIQFMADGLVGLFFPIFLFMKLDFRPDLVFIYYIIGHFLYALILPFGVRLLNKIGLRRSLRLSVFFNAAFLACFYFFDVNPNLFLALSIVALTIHRLLFWVPYHTDFAKFTDKHDRGKEVSLIWATQAILKVVMPIAAAFMITRFGFSSVFAAAIILVLSVAIPFMTLPRTHEKFSWGIWETFKRLFHKKNRKLVLANLANGAENRVGIVIWPIFIWQILDGNFMEVGAISSMIILMSVVLQLIMGKFTDELNKRKLLHIGSFLYAIGWLAKIFVLTASHIFFVGAYHSLTKILKDTPFDTLNYEMMADRGHYVDEYTVLKEMAISFGAVLMMGFALIIFFNFGLNWSFALAAVASLFINLL